MVGPLLGLQWVAVEGLALLVGSSGYAKVDDVWGKGWTVHGLASVISISALLSGWFTLVSFAHLGQHDL